MKLFVKITTGSFHNASRDKRELAVVKSLGLKTLVVAKGESTVVKEIDGWTVHALSTRPIGHFPILTKINRLLSLITWAYYIRSLKANYLSCHDLYALFIGWLSTLGISKIKRPILIYDSHEFEAGKNTDGKRGKIKIWLIIRLERFLIRKAQLNIMVNKTIAYKVQKLHKLKVKPLVVRNIPQYWTISTQECKEQRQIFFDQLQIQNKTFLLMYHGGIMRGRGIENLLIALSKLENVAIILLGNGENEYISNLKTIIKQLNIEKIVLFHPAVPQSILWRYVGAVDVGMITIQNICPSYYYSLPNKLFENIQAITPVIASNFPEIAAIVEEYNIGICCDPSKPEEIAKSIILMQSDNLKYNSHKKGLLVAKEIFFWEKEQQVLIEAYSEICI